MKYRNCSRKIYMTACSRGFHQLHRKSNVDLRSVCRCYVTLIGTLCQKSGNYTSKDMCKETPMWVILEIIKQKCDKTVMKHENELPHEKSTSFFRVILFSSDPRVIVIHLQTKIGVLEKQSLEAVLPLCQHHDAFFMRVYRAKRFCDAKKDFACLCINNFM